jgi:hypothetical protein
MLFEMIERARFLYKFLPNPANNDKKLPRQPQLEMFKVPLVSFINPY